MEAGREQRRRDEDFARDSSGGRLGRGKPRWWGTTSLNLAARQPVSHAIMFYLLSTVALIIFAPCVIVPIWRDVQKLGETERALRALVLQLNDQLEKNRIRIDALQNDPLVIERVARRELNLTADDEQHVRWSSAELAALRLNIPHDLYDKPELPPLSVPPWAESVKKWLPAWAWPELFAKSPNREFLLVMAGCLLLTAFMLYTPRAECRIRETA
jgi:hypothetical protein